MSSETPDKTCVECLVEQCFNALCDDNPSETLAELVTLLDNIRQLMQDGRDDGRGRPVNSGIYKDAEAFARQVRDAKGRIKREGLRPSSPRVAQALTPPMTGRHLGRLLKKYGLCLKDL